MEPYYTPKHFKLNELLSKKDFEKLPNEFVGWGLFDPLALMALDNLREQFGPIVVNNWATGGNLNWCGLRTPNCPEYSPTSQHTFGRAFDCHFANCTAESVRQWFKMNPSLVELEYPHVAAIELDVSWFHFDVRNCTPILYFKA